MQDKIHCYYSNHLQDAFLKIQQKNDIWKMVQIIQTRIHEIKVQNSAFTLISSMTESDRTQ